MTITIKYEYEPTNINPFFASTEIDGKRTYECSPVSFDEAEAELVKRIQKRVQDCPTVIPSPKEVEIDA